MADEYHLDYIVFVVTGMRVGFMRRSYLSHACVHGRASLSWSSFVLGFNILAFTIH